MARVLVLGATGFVGRHLIHALRRAGHDVTCGSRTPDRGRALHPEFDWTRVDVEEADCLVPAFSAADAVYYLVHHMGQAGDYETKERQAAERVRDAAAQAELARLIYLGGVRPRGPMSKHLRSRATTGIILRSGAAPTVELQAGMIIGPGSESFRMVRDLSVRLPLMLLPQWLKSRSQPIALTDVLHALVACLALPVEMTSAGDPEVPSPDAPNRGGGCYAIPGPETLTARQVLERVAKIHGTRPLMIDVPLVSPKLSAHWLGLVTRANRAVAGELVEGLVADLVAEDRVLWPHLPPHDLVPFDEAVRQAMNEETADLGAGAQLAESFLRAVTRKSRP